VHPGQCRLRGTKTTLAGTGRPGNTGNPIRQRLHVTDMASLTVAQFLIWGSLRGRV
jgi:hypothetical protein